jgi:hypothetical protein
VATGADLKTTDSDSGVLATSKSQESANAVETEVPVEGLHVQSHVPVDDTYDTTETVTSKKGPERDIACITISISRISIDDEIMQHRKHWHEIILPRLRMFVEAVYKIRRDDDKRYRLLASVADNSTATSWQILFDECPWLETCDTAFRASRGER